MAVVAKKDIENLTKQVLIEKRNIFQTIQSEHIQIDSSLLYEHFVPKFTQKLNKVIEPQLELSVGESAISLNDMETIINQIDSLDKNLVTSKQTSNPAGTVPAMRKETSGIKRFGSMTDINKTLVRSSSTLNLNSTRYFAEPHAPAPRSVCNSSLMPNNKNSEHLADVSKLSSAQLAEHNALKEIAEACLASNHTAEKDHYSILNEIAKKYKTSFDRLKMFFDEVQRLQLNKSVETGNGTTLNSLDPELLGLMKKLTETLSQVRFIAKNQNLYNSNDIKAVDSILSDDLTDILEQFYRINK